MIGLKGANSQGWLANILFVGALVCTACGSPRPVPDDMVTMENQQNPWESVAPAAPQLVEVPAQLVQTPPSLTVTAASTKLAVMDIEDRSGKIQKKLLADLTEYLRARLTVTGRFMVIDRSRQADKLGQMMKKEKSESYRDCYDKACQIPLGQALSADSILRATLSQIGNTYALSIEIVDLAREATVLGAISECSATPKKGLDGRLMEAIREIVKDLASRP